MEKLTTKQIEKIIFKTEITDKKLDQLSNHSEKYSYGAFADIYKFTGFNGKPYILKAYYEPENIEEMNVSIDIQNEVSNLGFAPRIYKVKHTENSDYLVMDFIDGITFKKYIKRNEYPEKILDKIFEKIEILISHHIVHTDLNVWNILINKNDEVFFIDFDSSFRYYEEGIRGLYVENFVNNFFGIFRDQIEKGDNKYRRIFIEMLKYFEAGEIEDYID